MIRDIELALGEKIPRCKVGGVDSWEELERKPTRERRRL